MSDVRGAPQLLREELEVRRVDAGGGVTMLTVSSQQCRLTFLPQFGGRLISLVHDGIEYLWRNRALFTDDPSADALGVLVPISEWNRGGRTMNEWTNPGGSKTWPAPQGWTDDRHWAGPPDPVIDSGDWSASHTVEEGVATVTLTSGPDHRTGLVVERRFCIPFAGSSFVEHVTFTNVSLRTVRWSMWEVCQLEHRPATATQSGNVVEIDVAAPATHVDLGSYDGTIEVEQQSPSSLRIPAQDVVAKRGFPSATGVVRYRRHDRRSLVVAFDVDGTATYPDRGSRAEVWMQYPLGRPIAALDDFEPLVAYVEVEVLSPLVDYLPGQSRTSTIHWSIDTGQDR